METNNNDLSSVKDTNDRKDEGRNCKVHSFITKHSQVISFILVIVIIVLWAVIKMTNMEKRALIEKEQMVELYENKMDSLSIASMEITGKVFSWAIRSEMTRENMEQVNQFFISFIQFPNVRKIQLVDPETSQVIISTDKKDEGKIIEDTLILQAERTYTISSDDGVKIISPVMGLNKKIGILIIEIKSAG